MTLISWLRSKLLPLTRLHRTRPGRVRTFRTYPIEQEISALKVEAERNLGQLGSTVYVGLRPPPGPYGFFHHISHAMERLADCHRVLRRLYSGSDPLMELAALHYQPYPGGPSRRTRLREEEVHVIRQEDELSSHMKQDFETLYIFGGILLDQWSLLAISVGGLPLPRKHPFTELVRFFESGRASVLGPIWQGRKSQMLWLYYQLRFYRNRFVVHGNRPWQRGTTRATYGDEFRLHTPSPPGWLDDERLNEQIQNLIHLAPEAIRTAQEDNWERARPGALIERIFDNIGNIADLRDRERVAGLFGEKGGSTPSFQIIAKNLLEFVGDATRMLDEVARNNLAVIDIGGPPRPPVAGP